MAFGDRVGRFTRVTGASLAKSLASSLIDVVDDARDIAAQLGFRPYEVHLVRTRWTAGERGAGIEAVLADIPLLPVPKVQSLDGLAEIMTPVGLDELGQVRVSGISGRYSEQFLRGLDLPGNSPAPSDQFFWELIYPTLGQVSDFGLRRRFTLASAPFYDAERVEWTCVLQRARGDRQPDGRLTP
jgi:hypothetical protein